MALELKKRRTYERKWRKTHKDHISKYSKRYYRKNRRKCRDSNKRYMRARRRTAEGRYKVFVDNQKYRNGGKWVCDISFEQFSALIRMPCYYCGGVLPEVGSGLDRIDSAIGYTIVNVRPCCIQCNQAKSNYSEAAFKEWIVRVYNNYGIR